MIDLFSLIIPNKNKKIKNKILVLLSLKSSKIKINIKQGNKKPSWPAFIDKKPIKKAQDKKSSTKKVASKPAKTKSKAKKAQWSFWCNWINDYGRHGYKKKNFSLW